MNRKNRQSKETSQRIHAKRRALERYGVSLTKDDYEELVKLIHTGKATHILKQSNTRGVFLLKGTSWGDFLVTYDKLRGNINTFLPKELIPEVESHLDNHEELENLFVKESHLIGVDV